MKEYITPETLAAECREYEKIKAFNRSEDNDPDFDIDTPYCPNCGAKMDKEE